MTAKENLDTPLGYYLGRLLPPRPNFAMNMDAREGAAMRQHAAYWHERVAERRAVFFGPVADPRGVWGLAIVEARTPEEAQATFDADPVLRASIGMRFEVLPLLSGYARA